MEGNAILAVGPFAFGLVIGWVTYRTLRHRPGSSSISDIATVLGAVGGGVVTTLFQNEITFAWYSVGLAVGFFLFYILGILIGTPTAKQQGRAAALMQ